MRTREFMKWWGKEERSPGWTFEKQCQGMVHTETAWASYSRQCRRFATETVRGKRYCLQHAKLVQEPKREVEVGVRVVSHQAVERLWRRWGVGGSNGRKRLR